MLASLGLINVAHYKLLECSGHSKDGIQRNAVDAINEPETKTISS